MMRINWGGEWIMKKVVGMIISLLGGIVLGGLGINYVKNKKIEMETKRTNKFVGYYNLLNHWLRAKQEGRSLEDFFEKNGIKSIAIYGMGELGNRLYDELKNSSIQVKYAIDKNPANTFSEVEVLAIEDYLEEVDAIVVTAIFAFDEIVEELIKRIDYKIISLEDIVYEL